MARGNAVKSEPSASATTEDTDDNTSVTSTPYDSEDPDAEYSVEDILAQDDDMDGVTKYLVRWTNYPLEKCTWEPEENMGHELLEDLWEEKKKRPDYKPFDLSLYLGALADKEARHLRRNLKRKRLGLPETPPFSMDDEVVMSEPVPGTETSLDAADAITGQDIVSAVAGLSSAPGAADTADLTSAAELASENSISAQLITDLTNDSGDDLVVLDAISAPATPKLKKKKKKKKDDSTKEKADSTKDRPPTAEKSASKKDKTMSEKDRTVPAKIKVVFIKKTGAVSKPALKDEGKDAVEAGTPRPTSSFSSTLVTSGDLPRKPKRIEKRKLTDGEKPADNTDVTKALKGPNGGARRVSEPGPSAPPTANNKEPATVRKPGQGPETATRNPSAFSARRSATTPQVQVTGNAFNSGEKIRKGPTLSSAMVDPSKPRQLFTKRRTLRQAEILQRDKVDAAIEPSLLSGLFPISKGPPSTPAASSPKPPVSSPGLEPMPTVTPTQPQTRSILALRRHSEIAPKRKKSVHFSDLGSGDDGSSSGRVLKSPPAVGFAAGDEDDVAMDISPTEPGKISVPMPDRAIKLLTGSQTKPVEAIFSVTAEAYNTEIQIEEVFGNNLVRFDYSCLADTLLEQLGSLRERNLFSGDIKASPQIPSSGEKLETISQRLKAMNCALFLLKPTFAMLLYPSRCQEWSEQAFGFPVREAGQAAGPLRYVVFKTYFDGSCFLRPHNGAAGDLTIPSSVDDREHLMRVFAGLDRSSFDNLFPRRDGPKKAKRNVFLAFPPSLSSSMQQLALWIRAVDASCAIFDSAVPGAWMAFREKISLDSEDGAIVVHELVISAVRRFPDLHNFLSTEDRACRIWALSQSIISPPIFSPIEPLNLDEPGIGERGNVLADFGKVTWTQLFPHGLAVLVTPTFIMSEPRRTYDLFRWISDAHRVGDMLVTLVAVHDICSFLKVVAQDKYVQYKKKLGDKVQRPGPNRRESGTLAEETDLDCRLRFETCLLAHEICETRETAFFVPTVFAEKGIDWNDEQSLVNWFGWWSLVHLDRYRLFHVVGTDMAFKYKHADSTKRTMSLPNFSPETVADPDVARERMQENMDRVARVPDITDGSSQTVLSNRSSLPKQAFRSQRFPDDSANAFTGFLMDLSDKRNFWRFYGYVVYWRDPNEAFKYGSLKSNPYTIKDWFSFTWPFTTKAFRTYIGFFYLADDSGYNLPANQRDRLPRHPFVVIYRPEQANLFPYKKTELLFWDPRAPKRFRGRDMLFETRDLTVGQRAVLDFVRKNGHEKNRNMALTSVYIGGRHFKRVNDRHEGAGPPLPLSELDATMDYLESLAYDFKDVLPPTRSLIEARGFQEVVMAGDARDIMNTEKGDNGGSSEMAVMNGGNRNARIVFHAPRGERLRHVGTSKCYNRFYDAAHQARMRNPRASSMEFEYRPTTEWYREQIEEGRDYDHISVDGWEPFFKTFKINLGDSH